MSEGALSVRYVGARRWRPPKVELRFDVTLRNAEAEPRWALLPDNVSGGREDRRQGVAHSIDVYELTGRGRAVALHLRGDGGFFAFLLPPGSDLALDGLPLSYWGELPERVDVALTFTDGLSVDGAPVENRLRSDPVCEPGARVEAGPLANQAGVVEALPGGGEPIAVEWSRTGVITQRVELEPALSG